MPISQAMILAAGKGTRLQPITNEIPKPLVKVGGQPLIVWHIKALKAAGITDITINTAWLSDKLMQAIGDGDDYGVNIHWSVEEEPLETAGGIFYALQTNKLKDEPFILVNGDIWTTYDFAQLVDYEMSADQLAHLLMIDNPSHNGQGDFAIQNGLASEQAIADAEKYTFSGISVMSPKLVAEQVVGQAAPLAPLLKKAMPKFQITAELIQDNWIDVGTPERLQQINDYIADKGAEAHQGRPN
ncbi:N-acetylmuramate alpha-1-phosphate uridylyltransferase MurU [Psychrobacter sp. I-STPA10]|uniref:N-acetylmuramate alpha-1-phosphate uridylyltransferase MurU n=1 Tax=Psychrobacter sp. I-STPA10 TaxID=2585769 RepID=UPI001E3534FC|nr:nucleotidyltransferase family protein [Psychrobacter sp. I-STPA10]